MMTIYELKVALCLAAFYLVWKVLLSRETLHRLNRVALLVVTILAFVLPLVKFTISQPTPMGEGMVVLGDLIALPEVAVQPVPDWKVHLMHYSFYINLVGGISILVGMIVADYRARRPMNEWESFRDEDGDEIHIVPGDIPPYSFFRHIVISEQDYHENGPVILTHEKAHIRLKHSFDMMLMELLILIQWWNPAAWLLRRELKLIHEYEADEAVLKRGVDARQYQLLLIRKSVGDQLFSMANNLNYQSLKKRIRMMKTKKSSRWQQLRALAIVPVAGLALVAFAQPEVESIAEQVKYSDTLSYAAPADTLKKAYDSVEKMPEFPGGMSEMMRFVSDNIRYPKDAMEAKKEGRALVEFVIETDGSISDVSVVKEVYPSIDAEAIRVVKSMPKWTPGEQDGEKVRVKFTMPIAFKLQGSSEKETVPLRILPIEGKSNEPAPLFIVDGKEASYDVVRKIAPETIESLTVLKDKAAVEVYGEKGKNGVVEVKLKK